MDNSFWIKQEQPSVKLDLHSHHLKSYIMTLNRHQPSKITTKTLQQKKKKKKRVKALKLCENHSWKHLLMTSPCILTVVHKQDDLYRFLFLLFFFITSVFIAQWTQEGRNTKKKSEFCCLILCSIKGKQK